MRISTGSSIFVTASHESWFVHVAKWPCVRSGLVGGQINILPYLGICFNQFSHSFLSHKIFCSNNSSQRYLVSGRSVIFDSIEQSVFFGWGINFIISSKKIWTAVGSIFEVFWKALFHHHHHFKNSIPRINSQGAI